MKTSARNNFSGSITRLTKGAVNAEVQLTTDSGGQIVAIVTNSSVDNLGLAEGKKAYALVKASSVILGNDLHNVQMSTRNILCGIVSRVDEGAVNTEVVVQLPGGELLTAIITNSSAHSLGFRQGEHACAAFKASSVILAVD
jgi:molybdate transport system regulatory protein